jgi:uncharacterized membrane protein
MGIGCFGWGIRALLFVCGTRRPGFGRFDCGLGTVFGRLLFLERLIGVEEAGTACRAPTEW